MRALILVDLQNDFAPGGALSVEGGDVIIPLINELIEKFDLVTATRDWHPEDHGSFAVHHDKKPGELITLGGQPQILWPVHCVQGSRGAEFIPGLNTDGIERVFFKGDNRDIDSYSGFFDNDHRRETGLGAYLVGKGVTEVYLAGLATDYCVKFTAMDAVALGFETHVISDAVRGVNLNAGDSDRALDELRKLGVKIVQSDRLLLEGDS